jgi:hypothetical protein
MRPRTAHSKEPVTVAGHRKEHGRPARGALREQKLQRRFAAAQTPEERLAAAYDGFRSVVSHLRDRGEAGRLADEAAQYLKGKVTHGSDG